MISREVKNIERQRNGMSKSGLEMLSWAWWNNKDGCGSTFIRDNSKSKLTLGGGGVGRCRKGEKSFGDKEKSIGQRKPW